MPLASIFPDAKAMSLGSLTGSFRFPLHRIRGTLLQSPIYRILTNLYRDCNSRNVEGGGPFWVTARQPVPLPRFPPYLPKASSEVDYCIQVSWYLFLCCSHSPERFMLFDFEKNFPQLTACEMAPQRLEERQRDIYDSHRHRVFSVSCYMTGNEIEAENLLRGAFVRAFRRAAEPDHAIIDSALVQELEEQQILRTDDQLPPPDTGYLPQRHNILRTELEEAIRYLPSTERLVFLLMDVEGYPAQQVSELLKKPVAAVLRTALTARMRLRVELAAMREANQQAA
jgi:RNA polymerase sigma-70 factor (ECF subfamily)